MRSVLARTSRTLVRSGLILAVLPVRAAAWPAHERAPRPSAAGAAAGAPSQDCAANDPAAARTPRPR